MKKLFMTRRVRTLGAIGMALGILAGTSTTAQAAASAQEHGCYGRLYIVSKTLNGQTNYWAQGWFQDQTISSNHAGWTCKFTLQRSTNGGMSFYDISGVHDGTAGGGIDYDMTGFYYDGPGYMARVMIKSMSPSGDITLSTPTGAF